MKRSRLILFNKSFSCIFIFLRSHLNIITRWNINAHGNNETFDAVRLVLWILWTEQRAVNCLESFIIIYSWVLLIQTKQPEKKRIIEISSLKRVAIWYFFRQRKKQFCLWTYFFWVSAQYEVWVLEIFIFKLSFIALNWTEIF